MKPIQDIDIQGCKDLLCGVIESAINERDIRFLKSKRCTTILNHIIRKDVDTMEVQRLLIKKAMKI